MKIHSTLALAIVGGLCVTTRVAATPVIGGNANVPVSVANDITIDFSYNHGVINPISHATGNSNTSSLPGSMFSETHSDSTASGTAKFTGGSVAGTSPVGWALDFTKGSGATIDDWFFTLNGTQVGPTYTTTSVLIASNATGSSIGIAVSNPVPTTPLQVTGFGVFVNQSVDLISPTNAASIATAPLVGSPVTGIPSSFTLDSTNSSLEFTTTAFPSLVSAPGTLIIVRETVGGAQYAWAEVVPEPSAWVSLGLGVLCVATYGWSLRFGGKPGSDSCF
ncbi:MAG TPA: hypothetical protein VFT74_09990 [Isosphaeraceae bacterium]|nr:hypothetical protein [Isosphaeraceae bacterium]